MRRGAAPVADPDRLSQAVAWRGRGVQYCWVSAQRESGAFQIRGLWSSNNVRGESVREGADCLIGRSIPKPLGASHAFPRRAQRLLRRIRPRTAELLLEAGVDGVPALIWSSWWGGKEVIASVLSKTPGGVSKRELNEGLINILGPPAQHSMPKQQIRANR